MKRGLKLVSAAVAIIARLVEESAPMKRGLKLIDGGSAHGGGPLKRVPR